MSEDAKGGQDPNEEHDEDLAKGVDHQPFTLSEGANKPPPAEVPYKITHSG